MARFVWDNRDFTDLNFLARPILFGVQREFV